MVFSVTRMLIDAAGIKFPACRHSLKLVHFNFSFVLNIIQIHHSAKIAQIEKCKVMLSL